MGENESMSEELFKVIQAILSYAETNREIYLEKLAKVGDKDDVGVRVARQAAKSTFISARIAASWPNEWPDVYDWVEGNANVPGRKGV